MPTLPEIELVPGTLVIADLHLDVGEVRFVEEFARWVEALRDVPRLVVLGDLFDVWVGPAQARMPGAPRVLDALSALRARGTESVIVPGNRDFLLDRWFAERTGVALHPDGFVGLCGGRRLLFVHGDTLCTKDRGYQRLRRVLRSGPVAWLAPRVPLAIGVHVARRLRRASTRALATKPPEEKSIQRDAVRAAAGAARAECVVCGHAHEFQDERLAGGVRWLVLDAFGGQRDVLRVEPSGDLAIRSSREPRR